MNLLDIVRELFAYLVRFREKAPTTAAPSWHEVQSELVAIFARMETKVRAQSTLVEPYKAVRYALVALADEVILTSGWDQADFWRESSLEKYYFGTDAAGERFFELTEQLQNASTDVVAVFYLCLSLGFCGKYAPDDPRLSEIKADLKSRLPDGEMKNNNLSKGAYGRSAGKRRSNPGRKAWMWAALVGVAALVVLFAGGRLALGPQTQSPPQPESTIPTEESKVRQTVLASATTESSTTSTVASLTTTTTTSTLPLVTKAPATTSPMPPKTQTTTTLATTTTAVPTTLARVSPPPPTASPAEIPTQPAGKRYRIQVGVFVGPIQSGRLADKLKKSDLPARVLKIPREEGKVWYMVVVEPVMGIEKAHAVQEAIKNRFKIKTILKSLK